MRKNIRYLAIVLSILLTIISLSIAIYRNFSRSNEMDVWIIITLVLAIISINITLAISISREADRYKEKLFDIFNFIISISDPSKEKVCDQIDQNLTYLSNNEELLFKYFKNKTKSFITLINQKPFISELPKNLVGSGGGIYVKWDMGLWQNIQSEIKILLKELRM